VVRKKDSPESFRPRPLRMPPFALVSISMLGDIHAMPPRSV